MQLFDIRRGEWVALSWAAAWFWCVLAAYYVIRPLRETFGTTVDSQDLAWWWTGTFLTMLAVIPLYNLVVSRVPRRWLVATVYGFFSVNLLGFWLVFGTADTEPSPAMRAVFYVWVSVFNLFVVTLFWGSVVDVFTSDQGKRLFGLIAGAGTLGGAVASFSVGWITRGIGQLGLLWISAVLLLLGIGCSRQLRKQFRSTSEQQIWAETRQTGLSEALSSFVQVMRSPYLRSIGLLMILMSVCGTAVYFQMMQLIREAIPQSEARTVWFSRVNAVQLCITLFLQTALASWLIRRFGLAAVLAIVPVVYASGFMALAITPVLGVLAVFEVSHRVAAFAIGVPSREVLFTAVAPEQKYRAKALIDTVGKRAGDVAAAHGFALLRGLGFLPTTISLVMLPVTLVLMAFSVMLGQAHQQATVMVEKIQSNKPKR